MTYTAPASRALTVLHVPDPLIPAVTEGPDPSGGATKCGLPMLTAELWLPVEMREGDTVCGCCRGVSGEQEAMW